MNDEIFALLKVHNYFLGAADETLRAVIAAGNVRVCAAGEVIHEPEDVVESIGFLLRGRLKIVKVDVHGRESHFRTVERGQQIGLLLGALQEPVPVRVVALEPSTVLQVDSEVALELTAKHPELRRLWLRTYAAGLRQHFFGAKPQRAPMMLGLFHESAAARGAAVQLLQRLGELGESLALFSDVENWRSQPGLRFRPLLEADGRLDDDVVRRQVADWHDVNRIVFDVAADTDRTIVERLMKLVDRAIYFVPSGASDAAMARLRSLDVAARGWRDKLSLAWLLGDGQTVAPFVPDLADQISSDFKLTAGSNAPAERSRTFGNGLERLVHHLRGVRIGVALGGGAARGMSHLGVLKALEQNGIVIDMVAGTSAGAMSGVVFASGLDSDYAANCFSNDLRPGWVFRNIPRGKYWYLLYNYRRGHFDPMLRKYLHDWRLEQLVLPCLSVTLDLVGGQPVVRSRGDAVHAILESINIPVLSVPICRDGQALVDGGLVNNIPADVLVSKGCNFVIAVSVTAKMEHRFADIHPDRPMPRTRPSSLQTIFRSLLVQNHSLNAIGVQPADVVIEPDVTGFDLSEFMKSRELAAVGEAAARQQIPAIRHLLNRLDPRLYPLAGNS